MSMVGFLMPIPDLSRGPLTAEELAALPATGIHLCDGERATGACSPPNGIIRQSLTGWWWHPTFEHARAAATVAGERCFLVGQGQNIEVKP